MKLRKKIIATTLHDYLNEQAEKLVACPNHCLNGMVKVYRDEKVLYDLVKCRHCKGKGVVTETRAKEIEDVL